MLTLDQRNIQAQSNARIIKRALSKYLKNELQSLAYLTLGMKRPERTTKANYLQQIINYHNDSTIFAGIGFLRESDFRHSTFYRTRKRLKDFIPTLPSNF